MTLDELVGIVKKHSDTKTLAVAVPHDSVTLKATRDACDADIARILMYGSRQVIERVAAENGIRLDGFVIHDIPDEDEAVARSVQAVVAKEARMLMKGDITTSTMMRAVLHRQAGIVPEGSLLSHVAVFYAPRYARLMLVTDAGININPNLERKVRIVLNSIAVAQRLGIARPRVALLAAIEKLNIARMPITVEAELIEKMGQAGMLGNAYVEGPFALDNAVSAEAAAMKRLTGEVAGKADILVAPDIEAGNILYKSLITFAGYTCANVVVGATVPIVTPSRVDSEETKLASIALASYLAE